MPLEHSTVLRCSPSPALGLQGNLGTPGQHTGFGSLADSDREQVKFTLLCPMACCVNGAHCSLNGQKWPPIGCCLLPSGKAGREAV